MPGATLSSRLLRNLRLLPFEVLVSRAIEHLVTRTGGGLRCGPIQDVHQTATVARYTLITQSGGGGGDARGAYAAHAEVTDDLLTVSDIFSSFAL